jgi:hypothetical protein
LPLDYHEAFCALGTCGNVELGEVVGHLGHPVADLHQSPPVPLGLVVVVIVLTLSFALILPHLFNLHLFVLVKLINFLILLFILSALFIVLVMLFHFYDVSGLLEDKFSSVFEVFDGHGPHAAGETLHSNYYKWRGDGLREKGGHFYNKASTIAVFHHSFHHYHSFQLFMLQREDLTIVYFVSGVSFYAF